ncbi:hypothetical protein CUMW_214540, partial [Citrus unshiu]
MPLPVNDHRNLVNAGRVTFAGWVFESVESKSRFSFSFKNGLDTKVEKSRKQLKERKNMAKKIGGVKKTKASDAAKK